MHFTDFLFVIGIILAFEGIACFLWPEATREAMAYFSRMEHESMRNFGLILAFIGICLAWIF